MTDTLMVGVSGVRGIVGKDLTPEVVTRWARAFGTWVRENGKRETGNGKGSAVVVGRDARESGPAFAAAVTTGLTLVGCDVIDVGLVPTPTVQLAVEHHHAGGGTAITASHNPIEWNALKFVGSDGIFLDGNEGARVAALAAGQPGNGKRETGKVTADPGAVERHLDGVLRLPALPVQAIRARRFTVALDAVRGAGGPVMRTLLGRLGCTVTGINLERDGPFPRARDPVPENLGALAALVGGRDAPVAAALLLALLARDGRRVSELVAAAPRYVIVKAKAERGARNAEQGLDGVYAALRTRFPEASVDTQDGLRLAWRDRWLHVRPSNTEPIVRLIAEAPTGAAARDLVDEGRRLCAASAS